MKAQNLFLIAGLIIAQSTMARAIYGPPNIPADRRRALRDAFMATMKDPAFLADTKKAAARYQGDARNYIAENPFKTLFVALGVGTLLGLVLRRRS